MKQEERNSEGSGDGDDDELQADGDRQGLMGNFHARRSWVDLSDVGEDVAQNEGGTDRPGRGSLSAKAGIILVRSTQNIFPPFKHFTQVSSYPGIYAVPFIGYPQHIRRHSAVPRDGLDRAAIRHSGATKVRAPWKPPRHDSA